MIEHTRDGDVHVLRMTNGENRMGPEFVRRFGAVLDDVEAKSEGACALVVTGEGKFFSNGIDLAAAATLDADGLRAFTHDFEALGVRLALLPVPTIAALNGHAFAGGAVFALACDERVMRSDRGWVCLNEVDVQVPLPRRLMNVVRAKLTPAVARDALLAARRFTGPEALANAVVDACVPEPDVLPRALERARALATKPRATFAAIKREWLRGVGD